MNVGVVFSGYHLGGTSAYFILKYLRDKGFNIEAVSASSLSAVSAFLYACGVGEERARYYLEDFIDLYSQNEKRQAVKELDKKLGNLAKDTDGIIISCASFGEKKTIAFTSLFDVNSDNLTSYPIKDAYTPLLGAVSEEEPCSFAGYNLIDYTLYHGIPIYPLKIKGIDKVISISFLAKEPKNDIEVLINNKINDTASYASIHIPIYYTDNSCVFSDYVTYAEKILSGNMNNIYNKVIF